MDINNIFINSIKNISPSFQQNELAYLALTSKPEAQLRDAIAFQMYTQCWLNDNSIAIDREWKRADLAVLKNNIPVLITEFKCAYTFDFIDNNSNINYYGTSVIKDLSKSVIYATDDTDIYAVLFAVHPLEKPLVSYYYDIKYSRGIIRAFSKYNTEYIFNISNDSIKNFFKKWNIEVKLIIINCGTAFNVPVQIICWIAGPFRKHEVIHILDSKK